MRKLRNAIISCALLIIIVSCNKFGPRQPAYKVGIYPGECLESTQLGYGGHGLESIRGDKMVFVIGLRPYWNIEEGWKESHIYSTFPSKEVYALFGDTAKKVKKAYTEILDRYINVANHYEFNGVTSTVYYCGNMLLKADKMFAGVPAGENIAATVLPFVQDEMRFEITPIPTIDVPDSYYPLGETVRLCFLTDNYEYVSEEVTFHLEIPVKVGLMLTLLRDRLTDPDAQMQYRDEVLTCDFTINHGLH
ncbi:MAG: hypothetical protein IKN31_05225 [Bacteroidales bacterium]|nr:hypothetical protein [Bacteroidales bacterium]